MRSIRWITAFVLLALSGAGSAWAYHGHGGGGHVHFGVVIGAPWAPWYYPPPYYYPPAYYPPVVIAPPEPQVYVEQAAPAPATGEYWYYCAGSRTYYPYVKECPGGWQKVAPQPPPQP